jgi:hypothetical protein
MTKKGAFYFCCILLKLFKGTCTERVSADDSDAPSFLHIMVRVFSASCCFAGTLQPDKHYNVLLASSKLRGLVFRAEHRCQLVNYGLCDKFSDICTSHIPAHLQ